MSEVKALLQTLCQQGIRLWPQEGKLRYRGAEHLLTPNLLAQLKTHKTALLQALSEPRYAPLAYGQKGLWLIQQSVPTSFVYNVSFALRLYFPIEISRWQEAAQLLVNRHAALRTSFPVIDNTPMQKIEGYQPVAFTAIDATTWSEEALLAAVQAAHERPFAITVGPLFRMSIFTHAPADHVLFVSAHHIAIDGWSIYLLIEELRLLYQALQQGTAAPLPPVTADYSDYVAWQTVLLQREGEVHWAYWQEQLRGALPLLQLPADYARPAVQSYRGVSQAFQLSADLTAQLKQVARHYHCTLYVLLLAAYEVLLHRYSGQDDILIGLTMAGRHHPDFARVIGYFTSPVVARADFSGKPTFAQLLSQVRQQVFTALEHQDYPFALLVEKLNPKRDPSRPPIFQANFVLQNFHHTELHSDPAAEAAGITVESIPLVLAEGQLDLSLEMVEGPQGLEGYLKGNADLFAQATLARMAGHWQTLLHGIVTKIVTEPEQAVARLPLLTAAERRQILVEWNQNAAPYPYKCMHQLFEAQVIANPDAPALFSEAGTLATGQAYPELSFTYGQANALANQLAHHLQSLGVGVETLVGLYVERSALLIVGLLGILKAGGAYVPLDLDAPTERIALMLEDTQSPVVVTQSHLLAHLPPPADGQHFVCLDQVFPFVTGHQVDATALPSSTQPFVAAVAPHHLAYILYTSGSTGKPKGVGVEHRQVAAYGASVIERCAFEPGLRYAMVQPLTVDSCMTMLYPALWTGGTLHVINRNHSLDPNALATTFQRYGIDCLKIAPSHFAALRAAAADPRLLMPRKRLVIGGEASKWQWMQELANEGSCQVHNHYGPTETTVGVTTYRVDPHSTAPFTNTPIGYPLANTQAYILNAALEPVPVGCVGELYIGGDFVARGYLHRPDLTEERFIPDPFAPPSADPARPHRLYRTGDWARYLPAPTGGPPAIDYLGRMDDQIKIHGFRIELGEIEAQIKEHPAVETSLVLARTDQRGEKQLVAYVVPKTQAGEAAALQAGTVREYLKQKLPSHMIPAAIILLAALPLSAHGKVDRQALPEPDTAGATQPRAFTPPQGQTEQRLAAIWAQVLGLTQVGRDDNFFEIGGDSIISLQVVSRAQAAGIQLTYRQIFEAQTIAALAQRVAETLPAPQPTAAPLLVTGTVPLTPIQRRFFALPHANLHHVNQSVLVDAAQPLHADLLITALTDLVQQHDALRLRFRPVAVGNQSMWTQHYADLDELMLAQLAASVHRLDLSGLPAAERQTRLAQINHTLQTSLNLITGPVWQVVCVHEGADQPDRLLMIVHHLMVDWVSWPILIADLWHMYGQRLAQKAGQSAAIQLPPKTSSFQAWSNRLQEYAHQAEFLAEVDYWLKIGTYPIQALPVDEPVNIGQDTLASVKTVTCRLSAAETQALLHDVPAVYHTRINDLLLTALAQSLLAWQQSRQGAPTGCPTVLLDLEHHGREALDESLDLARTVGWFTALFPVALQVTSSEPGALLKSIKEQLRQIPHNGIGYGILRYLNPETAQWLGALPKAELIFNYGGRFQSGQAMSLGGDQDANEPLGYRFRVDGGVIDEQLQFGWSYSQKLYQEQTVAALAQGFITALRALLAHCLSAGAGGYTPSDFPDLTLEQAALDQLITQIRTHNSPNRSGAVATITALYPLAPSQQGLLYDTLSQQMLALGTGDATGKYIEIYTYDLPGGLDVTGLQQAWQTVIARHTALRTGFLWTGVAEPVQFVLSQVDLAMPYHDWRSASPTQQEAQWQAYLQEVSAAGFDLARPPLMRLALFRLAEERHRLVWAAHHIVKDGWGTQIILREVMALYEARRATPKTQHPDAVDGLPPAPAYQSYIRWLKGQDMAQTAQFWREALSGFTHATALGIPRIVTADELQSIIGEFPGARRFQDSYYALPPAITAALQKLTREHRVSLNSLMQGTWALLLSRYSGASDVLFGATVSGRPAAVQGVESMLGLFINTIPIRVTVARAQPLWHWLQQHQSRTLALDTYAFCSAGQIHSWSELPGAEPLFESILVFQNYPKVAPVASGLVLEFVPSPGFSSRTQYALTIQIIVADSLLLHGVADGWRLSQPAVAQMLEHWAALLVAISEQPEQTVGQLWAQIPTAQIPTFTLVQQQQARATYVPPCTPQEQAVVKIWESLLGLHPIGIRDHFFALGGHSLLAMQLLARLQADCGRALPLTLLLQYPTVEALAAYLAQTEEGDITASTGTTWRALVALQPHGHKPPLFCLPGVEGNPSYLYPLAQALGIDQPVYSLQAVGLDGVTPLPASIEAEAVHYLTEIRRVQPHGPYYLSGHSRGGRVAYALAQQLRKEGEDVNLLALFDASWPGAVCADLTTRSDGAFLLSFVAHLTQATMHGQHAQMALMPQVETQERERQERETTDSTTLLDEPYEAMVARLDVLSPAAQVSWLKEQLERLQILPADADARWVDGLFRVYKNNLHTDARYQPTAPAPLTVTLFAAQDQTGDSRRPTLAELVTGWSRFAEVEVRVVPGNHFSMMAAPNVYQLAAQLSVLLS